MKPTCSKTMQGRTYKLINFPNHVYSIPVRWQLEGDVTEYAEVSLLTHLWESSRCPDHKLLSPGQNSNLPKKSRSGCGNVWASITEHYMGVVCVWASAKERYMGVVGVLTIVT